ncbi:ATP-binding cassette domain-containing protein [Brevibacillus massiliensis]|uniref:ATP-binding cassette domain-containing protein n=1 Tax=Brevibacillus massiliensis TaxID=1118054 RepID=UPI0002D53BE1|nr:ATP-binding cassette domain-containing protein [Brevibacillus massiliensis]
MSTCLLEFERVTKRFGGVVAVNDNSFQVEPGRVVSLIGPNGAGKTSTFNCITGMYTPDAGEVRFLGRKIDNMKPHQIAALGIARTFQNLQIFHNLTVIENVMVALPKTRNPSLLPSMLRFASVQKAETEAKRAAMEKLALVGLAHLADHPAKDLSFGEQRLLEVARALALEPKLLLLDEPMAGMSREEVAGMARLIRRLKAEGLSIFLIEHDLATVMEVSDKIIVLEFGSKIAEGTPEEISRDERVIEAYLGRDVQREYARKSRTEQEPPVLQAADLHACRGDIHALKGVSLRLYKGELAVIIGANGAGKSTLLGTIAGLYPARAGKVTFRERDITGIPAEQLARQGINLVPERRGMFPELTVEESLRLGAYCSRHGRQQVFEDLEKMYQMFPVLKERRKQLSGTLSGGEQQMLAIARGLMSHPEVLMLDEPSLGLAPMIVEEIFDKLYQLKQMGMNILLVEQNARAAMRIADFAYVLENGRIKIAGNPDQLMHDDRIRAAYLSGH